VTFLSTTPFVQLRINGRNATRRLEPIDVHVIVDDKPKKPTKKLQKRERREVPEPSPRRDEFAFSGSIVLTKDTDISALRDFVDSMPPPELVMNITLRRRSRGWRRHIRRMKAAKRRAAARGGHQ
jgi:hypothetical protein